MDIPALEQYIGLLKTVDHVLQQLMPAELQENEAFFLMSNCYTVFDKRCRYLYVSPYSARLLGFTPEQLTGEHWSDLGLPTVIMNGMEKAIRTVIETKEMVQTDSKDNAVSPPQYSRQIFFPLCESGKVVAVGQFTVDMTVLRTAEEYLRISMEEQHQSEESLSRSEAKFDKAFCANPNPITITASSDGRYIDVNTAFADMVGYSREELLDERGRPDIWQDTEQRHKAEDGMKNAEGTKDLGMAASTKAGKTNDVVASSMFIGNGESRDIMTSITDITEKKALQADTARLDRLNLIGEMAASLSHEIRNPLTTVRGFLQMIGQKDVQYKKQFEIMIGELDRANGIITELLSLAKNRHIERSKQNLNLIIEGIWPLMEADAVSQGKLIVAELSTGIPFCRLDGREIRQLILNLVRNGLEAIQSGKMVYVRTWAEDNKVVLSIRDEGQGIPEHIYTNLGMPFNTTKENGTGLGLPVCYRIVERHEATMDAHTGPDGTEFIIRFSTAE